MSILTLVTGSVQDYKYGLGAPLPTTIVFFFKTLDEGQGQRASLLYMHMLDSDDVVLKPAPKTCTVNEPFVSHIQTSYCCVLFILHLCWQQKQYQEGDIIRLSKLDEEKLPIKY